MADRQDGVVFQGGIDDGPATLWIRGKWFLQQDTVALFGKGAGRIAMERIRCGNHNGISKLCPLGQLFPVRNAVFSSNAVLLRQACAEKLAWIGDTDNLYLIGML